MNASVIILAPFPPPYHGAAKNSALLAEMMEERGVPVVRISTAAGTLSHIRTGPYHLRRLTANIRAFFHLLRAIQKARRVYMVPDGGLGLYYFFFHYLAALLLAKNIVLHHRTRKYVEGRMAVMALIVRLGRKWVRHVFLSKSMATAFQRQYGCVLHVICTNALFVANTLATSAIYTRTKGIHMGHLSNLCGEKGFFLVADLFNRLADRRQDIRLSLAGPVLEKSVQQRLDELQHRFPGRVLHHGPLYDKEKDRFYRGLDLFLFPTRYSKEAQPNVIYEALAAGVPVLATPRGCIPEMLSGKRGFVSPDEEGFIDFAVDCIEKRISWDISARQDRREEIRTYMRKECAVSERQYGALMSLLIEH